MSFNERDRAKLKGIVAFDEDDFPFSVDLSDASSTQSRSTGLAGFIASDNQATTIHDTPLGQLAFAASQDDLQGDPYQVEFAPSETALRTESDLPRMRFDSALTDGVDLFFSYNGSSTTDAGLGRAMAQEGGRFFQSSAYVAPFDQLAGGQTGGGASFALNKATSLSVSTFTSSRDDQGVQATMQKAEITHRLAGSIDLKLGYGWLDEQDGFLGSVSSGAFGSGAGGETTFFDVALIAPAHDKVTLFATYTQARSSISSGRSSLLANWSTATSDAFGLGLIWRDVATEGDGFSLMLGQPLRARSSKATLNTTSGRTEDGEVLSEQSRIELVPDGREITTEAVYAFSLGGSQALETGGFLRLNPDHDPDASPDVGFGARYRLTF
jgi:hypothetical protein